MILVVLDRNTLALLTHSFQSSPAGVGGFLVLLCCLLCLCFCCRRGRGAGGKGAANSEKEGKSSGADEDTSAMMMNPAYGGGGPSDGYGGPRTYYPDADGGANGHGNEARTRSPSLHPSRGG